MNKSIIEFSAPGNQKLKRVSPMRTYASDTINYIEAHFDLSDDWSGFDKSTAVWYTGKAVASSIIDANGITVIPKEVLNKPGTLKMNLSFSNYNADGMVKERATSYPVEVLRLV